MANRKRSIQMKFYVTAEEKRLIAVDVILANAVKPLHGIVPVLRQQQHEGQQPLRFQGQRPVPQVVVGHDRVISGFFDAENCRICRILSLVLKSIDVAAKSPCPASRTLPARHR